MQQNRLWVLALAGLLLLPGCAFEGEPGASSFGLHDHDRGEDGWGRGHDRGHDGWDRGHDRGHDGWGRGHDGWGRGHDGWGHDDRRHGWRDRRGRGRHHRGRANGRRLFNRETFGGNGRTCATCHGAETGTISPAEAQARFAADPNDPLFRPIDSDDGVGTSYTRLLTDATILIRLPLPPGWTLADDPSATMVTLPRAIPSTLNVPSLDDLFMADGRFDNLEDQALGAINSHYEPGRQPTDAELEAIARHQQTRRFFSSRALRRYARGGPPPELPPGNTPAEQRGRQWFIPSETGVCAHCHAGPMLNATSEFLIPPPGVIVPPGSRFFTAFVSELNKAGNPVFTFLVEQPDGTTVTVESPDPGLALITGDPADANAFRIPTLWGSVDTGPWFHDNSAKTLDDLAQHYSDYFEIVLGAPLTAQDQADIIAYLRLL